MHEITDKVILFICCFAFLVMTSINDTAVIAVIITIVSSAFTSFFQRRSLTNVFACLHGALSFFFPEACLFFPVLGYDVLHYNTWRYVLCFAFPLVTNRSLLSFSEYTIIILFLLLAFLLERRTRQLKTLQTQYFTSRDENTELLMRLESKNNELMDKQDYEVRLATLHERNRIARDIHDNVGHMLSRSLLQIGALLAIHKDHEIAVPLKGVKDTLSTAMTNIRDSIHDLHAESLDLYQDVRELLKGFTFCDAHLEYDLEEMVDNDVKYCFLTILREALTNITKHSNATNVQIILKEHPSLYQLVVQDNGKVDELAFENGIGLKNMETRVHSLQGVFYVSIENGFKIFITIPKKR